MKDPNLGAGLIISTMLRFVSQLLIVSLLTLNIAWADDECAFSTFNGSGNSISQIDDQFLANFSDTNFDCDEWCHVWSNPIDLLSTDDLDAYVPVAMINAGFYVFSYSFLPMQPPTHPPIIY